MIAQELSPPRATGATGATGATTVTGAIARSVVPYPAVAGSDRLKRTCDLLASLAFAVVAIPMIALAWVAVRLTSSGPGFYSQLRVGRNGHVFRIYKIRTMYNNCEAKTGPQWSTGKRDTRVTPIGRIFRKLHIDELPQLLNVLRGDMSLVGPRPERPEFVDKLVEQIPGYEERLTVRPGVTGLAQIQLPPDTDIESVRKKLVFDRCYVRRGGLWLDLRIMIGTAVYLIGFSYRAVRRAMRLPNPLADGMTETRREHRVLGPYRVGTTSTPASAQETLEIPVAGNDSRQSIAP